MNATAKLAMTLVVGAGIGGAAVHGLHAQAKPKAYLVTETEILDPAAFKTFRLAADNAQKGEGGRNLRTGGGKVTAIVGEAPRSVGITEFDSIEQAVAWPKSMASKGINPQREKAMKIIRQYAVEVVE